MEAKLGFSLGIFQVNKRDGTVEFKIRSENASVPDEIMLHMVDTWITSMKESYKRSFSNKVI